YLGTRRGYLTVYGVSETGQLKVYENIRFCFKIFVQQLFFNFLPRLLKCKPKYGYFIQNRYADIPMIIYRKTIKIHILIGKPGLRRKTSLIKYFNQFRIDCLYRNPKDVVCL